MATHQSKIAPASVGQVIDTAISLISRSALTGHQTMIAACPDLLKALWDVEAYLDRGEYDADPEAALEAARAAIAKAQGKVMVTAFLVELKAVCDERMPNLMLDLNDGTEDTQE